MAFPAALKFTYDDYLLFPDDGKRHELIEGDHVMSPAPVTKHQRVSSNLHRLMSVFVHQGRHGSLYCAPTDVVLSDLDVVQPDLLFISTARHAIITETHIHGAPDLVIEILSVTSRKRDELIKRKLYAQYGIPEYWIVDPELDSVKVYRFTASRDYERTAERSLEAGDTLSTPLLPGLTLPLADIFE